MNIEQHQFYQKWSKELDFYTEELAVFQKELSLVVEKHPDLFSIVELVEEYQRILSKKQEQIGLLKTQIKANDSIISNEENEHWDFGQIQKAQKNFIDNIEKLKKNFRRFVAINMYS